MTKIKIDMNNPLFQADFFKLEKKELISLIKTLVKIKKMSWESLYKDHALKWEAIFSKQSKKGDRIYSFRFSKKYRATAIREGEFLRLLTLHTDHDSTYKR